MHNSGWKRVMLKLSGEAFAGVGGLGIEPEIVQYVAESLAEAVSEGIQVAVVVGGGNMFRGVQLTEGGIERGRADYMGKIGRASCRERRAVVWSALALE